MLGDSILSLCWEMLHGKITHRRKLRLACTWQTLYNVGYPWETLYLVELHMMHTIPGELHTGRN